MADLRTIHHSFPTKMLLKRRRLLLTIVLVVFLFSIGCFHYAGRIAYGIRAIGYTDLYLQTLKPSAIHHNPSGQNRDIACVIETSLGSCQGIGFAAMVLQTIEDITTCLARGFIPTVIWAECEYCGPPGHGQNYWTWYFEAINEDIAERAKTRVCMGPSRPLGGVSVYLTRQGAIGELVDFRFEDLENKVSEYFQPITAEIRALASHVISGYLKPSARIKNVVDTFYESFMAKSVNIGVHVRLKHDHIDELNIYEQRDPKMQEFLQIVHHLINNITAENPRKEFRVYLASDIKGVIETFQAEFGQDKILHITAFRGEDMEHRLENTNRSEARLLGDQVWTEILLMAKCDYLVHHESSVSALTYYYNPNIKSHYVTGDASDYQRLNAQPRFDPEELLRQGVARETHNIRVLPDLQSWRQSFFRIKMKCQLLWKWLNHDTFTDELTCFYRNMKWSKCRSEFLRSKFARISNMRDLMGL